MLIKKSNKINNEINLYKKVNDTIHYISIKTQNDNSIVIIWGELEKEAQHEIYHFFDKIEMFQFFNNLIEEKALTYNYNPNFKLVKIGIDLSMFDEDINLDIWIPFTQVLESHLFLSGNGFITDDYYDEINNKDYYAFSLEKNINTAKFSVINLNKTMIMMKKYLEENETLPITLEILELL